MKKITLVAVLFFFCGWATKAQYSNINNNRNYAIANNNIDSRVMFRSMIPDLSVTLNNNTWSKEKADYLRKSHNRRIAAWSFLGGGAVLTAVGILSFPKGYDALFDTNSSSDDNKANIASDLSILGIACMITSIPFFISASMNKRRASLAISSQKTALGLPKNVSKTITGISLSVPIGK